MVTKAHNEICRADKKYLLLYSLFLQFSDCFCVSLQPVRFSTAALLAFNEIRTAPERALCSCLWGLVGMVVRAARTVQIGLGIAFGQYWAHVLFAQTEA